jgi:hypothetical protein
MGRKGYSSFRRPHWDQRITICTNERRVRYCAKQLMRCARKGTEPHGIAKAVLSGLDNGRTIDHEYLYMLEKYYRVFVCLQPFSFK